VKLSRALAGLLVVYSTLAGAAVTADESRERRSAEQIVPQLMVGDAVWLATPHHPKVLALYVEPLPATRNAVILVHGMGVNPDWNLIGVLRMALAELGFATLSVQMPVLGADAPRNDYNAVFPDAGERLDAATDWLRARSYERIAVVSHSMGSAMVNAWLAARKQAHIDAWVPVGLLVDFAAPPTLPVLDVVAEHDFPEALAFITTRAPRLRDDGCSAPLVIGGADHYFGNAAPRLAKSIKPFLDRVFDGGCRR
jgi:pimeloyl-ACP methyl ester carboxylesterase